MKRIALVLSLLFPFLASATTMLPEGCYVAFSNPNYCFQIATGDILTWTQSTDQSVLGPAYGQTVAIILSKLQEDDNQLTQCISDYNGLVTQYNGRGTQISTLNASLTAQKKLVKKLKKACGTKCKKIK